MQLPSTSERMLGALRNNTFEITNTVFKVRRVHIIIQNLKVFIGLFDRLLFISLMIWSAVMTLANVDNEK